MSARPRRDVRRFLLHRLTILEVTNTSGVRLGAIWKERFGYIAPLGNGALSGWHFAIEGGRAVVIARPDPSQVPEGLQRLAAYLIAAKHRVEVVRLADSAEIPRNLRSSPRVLEANLPDLVEQYPPPADQLEPVVLEHSANVGWYVHEYEATSGPWHPPTYQLAEALVFATSEEAEEWLDLRGRPQHLMMRYLSAALADLERRETEWVADGMV